MKLFEIKVFELESDDILDSHTDRYRFVNCWQVSAYEFNPVGSQGVWKFVDGYCSRFWSSDRYCEAWIVGEISRDRYMEADRFESVN